jgi:hypothetical protein
LFIVLGPSKVQEKARYTEPAVRIEIPYDGLNLEELWDMLIEPALLAMGYAQESIDKLVGASEPTRF